MKREEFAKMIHWQQIIWSIGLVNVGAKLPQLYKILLTQKTDDLAVSMFVIFLVVELAFSLEGYFKRNKMLMVCLALSASVSLTIISLVVWLRHFGA